MREIKFRAWNKEKKIMCYDNEDNTKEYFDGINSTEIGFINYRLSIPKDDSDWYFRSRYDVMQYTGLKDNNGKEIYERDIVQFDSFRDFTERYEVEYTSYGEWGIGVHRLAMRFKACEVIGNIYENPELLGDSE